ncbi:unnamed protein product [Periconia digitata]|uniref:Uncharacterized protein n=1 Tax=Periconia digitata TaxID=1303443 RepID=A0A9W4UR33_9PLEO|nr:unnamed protein product [Periconia digitata]
MEESESPLVTVALGMKGAWIVIFEDGSRVWDLRRAYPSLASNGKLSNSENRTVFVALNPYQEDSYFHVAEDGQCSYSANFNDDEEGRKLHEMTDSYIRFRAKRDNSTFTHSMKLNGVDKVIKITPHSSPSEGRMESILSTLRARQHQGLIQYRDVSLIGAVAGGTGVIAKISGSPTTKAAAYAATAGLGAVLATLFHRAGL